MNRRPLLESVFFTAAPPRAFFSRASLARRPQDNLTIPFFSALALQVALYRVRCPPCANVREARCYLF